MATKLNSEIIQAATDCGGRVLFSFGEGNRNVVAVCGAGGAQRFYHVRPLAFHRDMREAGFVMTGVNPYYIRAA